MSRHTASLVLAGAAVVLVAVGLATGTVAAALSAPLAAGCGVAALWLRREAAPAQSSGVVALGAATAVVGLGLLLGGVPGGGLLTLALGAAMVGTGARLALAGRTLPSALAGAGSRRAGVRTLAAVAADEAMRFVWQAGDWLSPARAPGAFATELRAAAERHRERGWLDAPERAHPVPPSLEKCALRRVSVRGAAGAERLAFESEYEPWDEEIREAYQAVRANRTAVATLWRHADGPRPALICLHGYAMGRTAWDARAFDVRWLHRDLGLDVVLPVLPLHGPRARGRRSGEGFLGGHPLWTNAAFGQAVWELRRLAGWLRAQGAPAVGVYGLSLGGYTAALFASVERRLACAVPGLPFASLADLQLRDLSARQRLARDAAGVGRSLLEEVYAPHAVLRHSPRVAPEGRLILAGLADRICPPDQAWALFEHWERPAAHWDPGSHLWPLDRSGRRAHLGRHLRETLGRAAAEGALPLTRFRS